MELDRARTSFEQRGLKLAALSYDSVAVLRTFAQRVKLGFPLMSDPGSRVIDEFGLRNTGAKPGAIDFGVPHPGIFVLEPNGRVRAKFFDERYQVRSMPETILASLFGGPAQKETVDEEKATPHLTLKTRLAPNPARPGNRLLLTVEVQLPPKMHVYAPGVKGYRPTSLVLDANPDLEVGDTKWPRSRNLRLPAIKETARVFDRSFVASQEITILHTVRPKKLEVRGVFEYQACDDKICYVPERVPLTFVVDVVPLDAQRVPAELQRKP